jgi:uncharacterized membrane protein YuzA (DUF378 family)
MDRDARRPLASPPEHTVVADAPATSRDRPTGCDSFFDTLGTFSTVLAIKLYRLQLERPREVPVLPCLDHEAMLHETVAPHGAAYIQDRTGDLHEVVYIPDERRIDVDGVSTMFERTATSEKQLLATLAERFPGHRVRTVGPSWIRGDLRVAAACRAQVALRDVLSGHNLDEIKRSVDRLQTISSLMEKQSRVASWGARTVMTPILAVAGFVSFQLLATIPLAPRYAWVSSLRYGVVGLLGAYFLYYGLKAVQLTEMANRVWKRSAEYGLILSERKRLGR